MAKCKISDFDIDQGKKCRVYKESCPIHDFVHGAEAEELRKGIGEIITLVVALEEEEDSISALRDLPVHVISQLQKLLNKTDARDSLAFVEAQEK